MNSFYIKVDTEFLDTLDIQLRTRIEKEIPCAPNCATYIRMCPYCNVFYTMYLSTEKINKKGNPKFCVHCGEPSPFDKFEYSIKKVHTLHKLVLSNEPIEEEIEKTEVERVLLEQCIVIFATGFELFLKDIYVIGMNLKFVKNECSLFSKFYKDVKNEFLNIGKLSRRFKDELDIDIKSLFGKDLYDELNLILLKRNAIVHNNGLVDKTFISQSNITCKPKTRIPISIEEIENYLSIAELLIEKTNQMFSDSFYPELKKKIDLNLQAYYLGENASLQK